MNSPNSEQPLVSVIMPTYNHGNVIGEAIESVLNQTYQNFELIIIDNYSEDDTEKIVASYEDNRIIYLKFRNNGIIAASRNYGIKHVHGEYIAFLDSDDLWLEQKLEFVIDYFKKVPGVDVVCHDEWLKGNSVRKTRLTYGPYTTYRDMLFKGNSMSTSATVVRTSKLFEAGLFYENLNFNGVEDYDFWMRLARSGCRIKYLHKVLGVYRVWGQAVTNNIILHIQHGMNLLEAHFQRWQPKNVYYRCLIIGRRAGTLRGGGHAFMKQGDHREAQKYLCMALKQNPFDWKTWVLILLNAARISK
ncbi:MAG: glycosyltransferase family 2 protein [bacterium]